ncbi:MAG: DUF1987 domain-containing protein [Oscillospiraceae bacterium]|jgi:hypothetical protein|nr:DUF1987 domain-containing protein [Oscillospiraceae bacterium]
MGLVIEKQRTGSTPYVYVDEEKGYIKMEGESFHENVIAFFADVNDWLDSFLETDFTELTFDCAMEYFNSSTAKLLLNMILSMDSCASEEKKVTVNWITTEDNDIIIECGEDFQEEVENLKFNMVIS